MDYLTAFLTLCVIFWFFGWLKPFLIVCAVVMGVPLFFAIVGVMFGGGSDDTDLSAELIRLSGSRKTAARLVRQIQNENPRKSKQWCVDKALWDLRRDRR